MWKKLAPIVFLAVFVQAQTPAPQYIALGDSLGEGVQSADASYRTQFYSYPSQIAHQLGAFFPLPLIKGNPFALIGSVNGRSRINPGLEVSNLAVSGADSTSILYDVAGLPVENETDLVLQPRTGSQIDIAEQVRAPFVTCWIGSNDALGTVLAFDRMDASQLTPLTVFAANYHQIVTRLIQWQPRIVFANVPNVTEVGFLVDRQDLIRFLGKDFGFPDGSYTSIVAMLLLKLGINNGSLLTNPNWVLDPNEVQVIEDRIGEFNAVILNEASLVGMPVVDVNGFLKYVHEHPIPVGDVELGTRFLGGIYSLDGVHPSNIGHAAVANEFIKKANSSFGWTIPLIGPLELLRIFRDDPFVDFDGDNVVAGRPLAGLLETLGPFLGISGDYVQTAGARVDPLLGPKFMQAYFSATGRDPNSAWNANDATEALRHVLALRRWKGRR